MLFLFWILFALQIIAVLVVLSRKFKSRKIHPDAPFVTHIRPCSGDDPMLMEMLASGLQTGNYPCKHIFCVASKNDPAYEILLAFKSAHPNENIEILSEEKLVSFNPKLNNLAQAQGAFEGDFILMSDNNVLFEAGYLKKMMGHWESQIGLLTSPPAGIHPQNFAAHLEASFLNTYQGLWQLAADSFGNGYAQGKLLFWRRTVFEHAGGFAALGHDLAEDVASTKLTRRLGYKVKLLPEPVMHPLGKRHFKAVWQRQVRWAKIRRFGFPWLYAIEFLSFGSIWGLLALGLILSDALPFAMFIFCVVLRYMAEFALAFAFGWPRRIADIVAWILRDALLLPIWIAGYLGSGFEWQGHKMSAKDIEALQRKGAAK